MKKLDPVEKTLVKAITLCAISISISVVTLTTTGNATADTPTKLKKAEVLANATTTTKAIHQVTPIMSYRIMHNPDRRLHQHTTVYVYEDPLNPGKVCRLTLGLGGNSHSCEQ